MVFEGEILALLDIIGKNGPEKGLCVVQEHNINELS
jgi:hypothetical protein